MDSRAWGWLAPATLAMLALALVSFCPAGALASHVRCGDTITANTTLDSDLLDCAGDGIGIGADGITLDLNGHSTAPGTERGSATQDTIAWRSRVA
jgi:hypothetical protein